MQTILKYCLKNTGIFDIFVYSLSPLRKKTILEDKEPAVILSKFRHLIWKNNKNLHDKFAI